MAKNVLYGIDLDHPLHIEDLDRLTEDIRLALDDLLDALHPDNNAEVHVALARIRAFSVSAQLRCLEDEIAAARTLKAQQGAA